MSGQCRLYHIYGHMSHETGMVEKHMIGMKIEECRLTNDELWNSVDLKKDRA